ncbi:hypothetical protein [Novosphingobium aureum]|nr:hypothetical protein [Novosphingobium aureum]
MMRFLRSRTSTLLAATAVLAMSATPALARGRHGPPRHHHHHRGGSGAGDLLAGLLVIGGIAAIASNISARQAPREAPYEPDGPYGADDDAGYGADYPGADGGDAYRGSARPAYPGGPVAGDDEGYAEQDYPEDSSAAYAGSRGRDGSDRSYGAGSASASFGMAVDTCSEEIERSGERRIGSLGEVTSQNGRVAVSGRLTDGRGFACSIDDTGRLRSVAVDGHAMI